MQVNTLKVLALLAAAVVTTACDKLPIPDPNRAAALREQEAKAIGGACRHAGRALEDCYTLNPKASKAAIFAGWREMNDYMTQNKIDVVLPTIPSPATRKVKAPPSQDGSEEPSSHAEEPSTAHDAHGSRNPALTAG